MPNFVFVCPQCKKHFYEDQITANSKGTFTCPSDDKELKLYDLDKTPQHTLKVELRDPDGKVVEAVHWVSTPWHALGYPEFEKVVKYIQGSMKLLRPDQI